jgi:short-subunit dehydrogenase
MIGSKDGYALITGASSGIGYEFAKLFARDGKNIVVVARSQDKLEELKREIENKFGTSVKVLVKDLSNPISPQEIYSELEKDNFNVDVLINNAGFSVYGVFSETELQKELEMIQVNIASLVHLTKLFLSKMLERKSGKILNVASTGGFIPAPFHAVYCASKGFVIDFSEALANELQGTGVSVTCLCPGATKTLFWDRGNYGNARAAKMKMHDAAVPAEAGYTALGKGKVLAIPGLQYKLLPYLCRILPRKAQIRMMRWSAERV